MHTKYYLKINFSIYIIKVLQIICQSTNYLIICILTFLSVKKYVRFRTFRVRFRTYYTSVGG